MAKELEQISFLDDLYERYQIKKPIKMIELFAGYGSQKLAMEHLGIKHESFKICEWNAYSMLAYKYLHSTDTNDYSSEMTKDQIVNKLFELNVSLDWNKPAEKKQLMNRNEKFLRDVYNAIISTNNLVDISRAKGKDFEMREREMVRGADILVSMPRFITCRKY